MCSKLCDKNRLIPELYTLNKSFAPLTYSIGSIQQQGKSAICRTCPGLDMAMTGSNLPLNQAYP